MAHLYFLLERPELPTQVLVWDAKTLTIGRSNEADLILEDDDEISRTHAVITQDASGFEVADYRTGNGTFVDGERLGQVAKRFLPGMVIGVGKAQLTLCNGEDHPATLGHKLFYVSQLKTVGHLPAGADGNATVLGLGDPLGGSDEEFVIEPMRSSGEEAFEASDSTGMREFASTADELADCFDEDPMAIPSNLELDVVDLDEPGMDLFDEVLEDAPSAPAERPLPPRSAPAAPAAPPVPAAAAPAPTAPAAAAPAPAADASGQTGGDPLDRMRRLKLMLDEGLISDEEFQATRTRILQEM